MSNQFSAQKAAGQTMSVRESLLRSATGRDMIKRVMTFFTTGPCYMTERAAQRLLNRPVTTWEMQDCLHLANALGGVSLDHLGQEYLHHLHPDGSIETYRLVIPGNAAAESHPNPTEAAKAGNK
jgi:hypothetical protein